MQDLKVGIVQTHQYWEDKQSNFDHFGRILLKHFSSKKVDLILLPEMFNTGFSMNPGALAENMQGESVDWLVGQASKYNCEVAATLIIRENDAFFNRQVVASGQGILSHYDKRHLFRMAGENGHYTAGDRRVVHRIKGWNILLQTCYDLRFPVFSRNHFTNGQLEYDCAIYLANWPEKRAYAWRNLLQARATENQSYCIGVNRTGSDGTDLAYAGDSMAINPWGIIEVDCANRAELVKICTLKHKTLVESREKFPAFLDAD